MAAIIINKVKNIKVPENPFEEQYEKDVERYKSELKNYCLEKGGGPDKGEILEYQIADGYAYYMILSYKPLRLIHLKIYDAYEFYPINRFSAKQIKEDLREQQLFSKFFFNK